MVRSSPGIVCDILRPHDYKEWWGSNDFWGHGLETDAPLSFAMSMAKSRISLPLPLASPVAGVGVGVLLRHWRTARRLSQLELALDADISSRHLSYVETGRSRPSREMVLRLSDVLEVPLRERNTLLVAAGYAPGYFETGLVAPEMAQMRRAIELILRHQEPYPAFVLDRHWNIRMSNQAAPRCTRFLLGADSTESNMMRLVLHPNGVRSMMVNWEETAGDLIGTCTTRSRRRRPTSVPRACWLRCSPILAFRNGGERARSARPRRPC